MLLFLRRSGGTGARGEPSNAARRVPPGVLTTPGAAGAVSAPVCRLSGLRATPECARLDEWFKAGTPPARPDDWERDGRVVLPDEYAEWSREGLRVAGGYPPQVGGRSSVAGSESRQQREPLADSAGARRVPRFRILSPLDGDRYAIPSGIEARYATIAFKAGGVGADSVQWLVDGRPFTGGRWPLAPGRHVVRAVSSSGMSAEARILVER